MPAKSGSRAPSTLAERQIAFVSHLRDPDRSGPPSDVEPRRMAIYRDLLFANVENLLASNFPVLRSITPEPRWRALVRGFLAEHEARTPLFHRIAVELLAYLDGREEVPPDEPPFVRELAHYEWMETEIGLSPLEADLEGVDLEGDLLEGVPVLSPLARRLEYVYAVHRIGLDEQPSEQGARPTHLVVYRDAEERVRFLEITPMTARLLELIEAEPERSGRAHLEGIALESPGLDRAALHSGGQAALEALRERGVLLGSRRAPSPSRRATKTPTARPE
ncbi:MAG: putative DNA-binding domain-containing protein [Deltaproteobacteria bacterium]|jgi:hypothetical protein|nr:putative DNA-binding domain-containing protein [Deltaproteobacteria bacterium]